MHNIKVFLTPAQSTGQNNTSLGNLSVSSETQGTQGFQDVLGRFGALLSKAETTLSSAEKSISHIEKTLVENTGESITTGNSLQLNGNQIPIEKPSELLDSELLSMSEVQPAQEAGVEKNILEDGPVGSVFLLANQVAEGRSSHTLSEETFARVTTDSEQRGDSITTPNQRQHSDQVEQVYAPSLVIRGAKSPEPSTDNYSEEISNPLTNSITKSFNLQNKNDNSRMKASIESNGSKAGNEFLPTRSPEIKLDGNNREMPLIKTGIAPSERSIEAEFSSTLKTVEASNSNSVTDSKTQNLTNPTITNSQNSDLRSTYVTSSNSLNINSSPVQIRMDASVGQPAWGNEFSLRVSNMAANGQQTANLQLRPAELGSVEVRLITEAESTRVHFVVQNNVARELIEQAIPRLREGFEQAGMNLDGADVSSQQSGENLLNAEDRAQASTDDAEDTLPTEQVLEEQDAQIFSGKLTADSEIDLYI